ncbi:MAG: HK97 family phage prohead protease [Alphaproteobacteria bacterium]|nr:MAG: HK97 family phage prohead protease [Alphaproteobacteria bacterium]
MLSPHQQLAAQVFRPRTTIEPDGTVEGYASLFGELDAARDMVMPGAFARTLKLRGVRRVPMLFQHDPAEPVGVWLELTEDFRGLRARGKLIPEVARARELFALVRSGAVDGLSIGFRTVKGRVDPASRVRKIIDLDLWEISIVTFPLLAGARVRAVEGTVSSPPQLSYARARAEREWSAVRGGVARAVPAGELAGRASRRVAEARPITPRATCRSARTG